jgi:hypothetical protein
VAVVHSCFVWPADLHLQHTRLGTGVAHCAYLPSEPETLQLGESAQAVLGSTLPVLVHSARGGEIGEADATYSIPSLSPLTEAFTRFLDAIQSTQERCNRSFMALGSPPRTCNTCSKGNAKHEGVMVRGDHGNGGVGASPGVHNRGGVTPGEWEGGGDERWRGRRSARTSWHASVIAIAFSRPPRESGARKRGEAWKGG